jgi:uncharacterized membrane protein YcaP (DUF421 family)
MNDALVAVFGRDGDAAALTVGQMAARAVVIYGVGWALLRVGGYRVLGRYAAFDVVLGIMLGSILSRTINSDAPFLPTVGAGAALVAVHRVLAAVTCRLRPLARFVKGDPHVLVERGVVLCDALRRHGVGAHDLEEAVRMSGHRLDEVETAVLERNGQISVLARSAPEPEREHGHAAPPPA